MVSGQTPYTESTKFAPGVHDCARAKAPVTPAKSIESKSFFIRLVLKLISKIYKTDRFKITNFGYELFFDSKRYN
jgi:hypothetical protein